MLKPSKCTKAKPNPNQHGTELLTYVCVRHAAHNSFDNLPSYPPDKLFSSSNRYDNRFRLNPSKFFSRYLIHGQTDKLSAARVTFSATKLSVVV